MSPVWRHSIFLEYLRRREYGGVRSLRVNNRTARTELSIFQLFQLYKSFETEEISRTIYKLLEHTHSIKNETFNNYKLLRTERSERKTTLIESPISQVIEK